jgi:hypothetical protein
MSGFTEAFKKGLWCESVDSLDIGCHLDLKLSDFSEKMTFKIVQTLFK